MHSSTSAPYVAPTGPAKTRGKDGKHRETAHFIKLAKKPGVAKVKLQDGAEIDCTPIGAGLQLDDGDAITIEATYDDGVVKQARFLKKA